MANTSIRRTNSSNGNRKKWTFSAWIKRTGLGSVQRLLSCDEQGNNNHDDFYQFQNDDTLVLGHYDSGYYANLTPNRKFRDTNAWYHFVITWDTAQSTAADRFKFYVNGVQETSFSTSTYPSQNADSFINTTEPMEIGKRSDNDTQYLDAMLTHVHFCDGYAYQASDFGETDSTTGIWKAKTSPSVNYGTNGFFILKNGNSLTDQSSNSNNWTSVSGTLTDMKDCPDNVFATMNPLGNYVAATTLSNGNNTVAMTNSKGGNLSTLACTGGKYYAEMKIATMPSDSRFHIGIMPHPVVNADDPINTGNNGIMLSGYNAVIYANSGSGSAVLNNFYGSATGRFSGTPILGCAVDLSSATKTMAISINGAWISGSNTTDASFSNALKVDISTPVALEDDWFFGCGSGNGSGTTGVYNWNFGNGYFGTTAISSEGTNASNIGKFEYDVPAGYTALSTKGLNE